MFYIHAYSYRYLVSPLSSLSNVIIELWNSKASFNHDPDRNSVINKEHRVDKEIPSQPLAKMMI